ncbi:hypothetical protein [Dechloromonas sp. HYN0024]|uniref:hypothetical protein n=1 Tax=Dechloromonas sp. HYN0024 TaxID=2231055 RepID=UPI000E434A16|nr:hypothetical protein [Dechloromonas sp. HYN0024]AXS79857.1 hypothetical protein HYN24_07405 [Dechloromonas sp. HYN0024]
MALKIDNPYFKTPVEIDAARLAPIIATALQTNAQAVGAVAGLVEIRALLSAADAAALTRTVFNQVCHINGWNIINPTDAAA